MNGERARPEHHPGAVAVLTVWFERGDPERPRARITMEHGDPPHRTSCAAVGVEAICLRVRDWLEQL